MQLQQPFAISNFFPTQITGCKLWLYGGSLALSDGDPVATWTDSSGSGNDAAQGTGGNKPLYKVNIINGFPAVLFDGTDDFMTLAGNPILGTSGVLFSVFAVIQPTLNTASQKNYATVVHGPVQSGFATFFLVVKITTSFWGTVTASTGDLSSTNALTSGSKYLIEITGDNSNTTLYQHGTQVATRAEQDNSPNGASSGLGKDLVNANRQYAGYMAEVLIYNTLLSAGNRAKVENYLIRKYAL